MRELLYFLHLVNFHHNILYTDDIDCELLDYVPDFEFFDKEQRNCFIIEDCDVKSLNKQERHL